MALQSTAYSKQAVRSQAVFAFEPTPLKPYVAQPAS